MLGHCCGAESRCWILVHFGTHLPHSQVVNQNASNQFLINPKLVRHHANGEEVVGAHQFSHLFDVDISFDAARPSRFSIILHTQPTIHKPLMPLKDSCPRHARIAVYLKQHVKSLRRRFSQFNTKFDVGPLFNTHYCDIQHKRMFT